MKKLLKFALLSLSITSLWSCNDDKDGVDTSLPVIANNVAGVWQLTEWSNNTLADGSFVYIELTRKDKKFTMYENLDSFDTRVITGIYNIESDAEYGPVIRGIYDYGIGEWQHRYIVSNLTKDSMTWIALDDLQDIQVYKRCEKVPDEVIDGKSAKNRVLFF